MSRSRVAVATLIGGRARAGMARGFGDETDALRLAAALEAGREQRIADGVAALGRAGREAWRFRQQRGGAS